MFEDVVVTGSGWSAPDGDPVHPGMCTEEVPGDPADLGGPTGLAAAVGEEGVAALLDPAGARDRMRARAELAGMFDVESDDPLAIPDGPFDGIEGIEEAPNHVTAAEFDHIVELYSDIRLGRTDLHIDTAHVRDDDGDSARADDATAFRDSTMSDIANILQTESGRTLIDGLAHDPTDRTTEIRRRYADEDDHPEVGGVDNDNAFATTKWNGNDGSGMVRYVPGDSGGIVAPGVDEDWLPMRSDVALYHELTHVRNDLGHHSPPRDTPSGTPMPEDVTDRDFVRANEYQVVGVGEYADEPISENVYRAERRAIGATDIGERTTGGVSDDEMSRRDHYHWHAAHH